MPLAASHPSTQDSPARRWASITDTAEYLGITRRTVRLMVAQGRIRAYRNGPRLVRIDLNEVDAAMTPYGGGAA
ncbi:excisionase family DNA-binding protein [Mycobacterium sp. E787]|uniref:excisionase family DNA-binding protein n=1 Tax=Mycobacterium sp. E787 TaxID=1834150 RepID=UPI0008009071|nr:excisionase family DNA-binding protein [Mycobacterium sp. E787]OBI53598.1 DNA-binding protein [Mycobacterium sp. E787]